MSNPTTHAFQVGDTVRTQYGKGTIESINQAVAVVRYDDANEGWDYYRMSELTLIAGVSMRNGFQTGQRVTWRARGYIVAIHDSGVEVKFTELADTLIVPFEEIETVKS